MYNAIGLVLQWPNLKYHVFGVIMNLNFNINSIFSVAKVIKVRVLNILGKHSAHIVFIILGIL